MQLAVGAHATHHDGHRAHVGELDGVSHQVAQNLEQPHLVGYDVFRRVGRDVVSEAQVFLLGAVDEQGADALHHGAQLDDHFVHLELASLDFRQVENVVQNGEQGIGAFAQRVYIVELLVGFHRLVEQVNHAYDAIHGRAQLVAHVGQELGFGFQGGFGFVFGQA